MNTEAAFSSSLKRNIVKSKRQQLWPYLGKFMRLTADRLSYYVIVTLHQNSCPGFEQWLKTSELAYKCWDHFQQLTQNTKLPFSVNPSYFSLLVVAERVHKGKGSGSSGTGRQRAETSLLLCFWRDDSWNDYDIALAGRLMKRSCPRTSLNFLLSARSHLGAIF